jgi:hypothetical protein
MRVLLNETWAQVGYYADGHLVHTDKRTGKLTISVRVWPDIVSANRALSNGLTAIEWDEWDEF